MPLHFDAITEDAQNTEVLAWILRSGMEGCDSVFVSADKFYFHIRTPLHDDLTGDKIGDLIYKPVRHIRTTP